MSDRNRPVLSVLEPPLIGEIICGITDLICSGGRLGIATLAQGKITVFLAGIWGGVYWEVFRHVSILFLVCPRLMSSLIHV